MEQSHDWIHIRAQSEDSGGGSDPSDPTQTVFHVITEFEWIHLRDGQGDLAAFKVSPFIPFEVCDQNLLFNFEVPLQYADTEPLGSHTDIGDTRMKLFWLIGTDDEFVRAIVPSFDAVAPTGDEMTGTGGGGLGPDAESCSGVAAGANALDLPLLPLRPLRRTPGGFRVRYGDSRTAGLSRLRKQQQQ